MEIKKTIKLKIEKGKESIIVKDLATFNLVMGGSGYASNLHIFPEIKRTKFGWIIPFDVIKQRIQELEYKKEKIEEYLSIMRQVRK